MLGNPFYKKLLAGFTLAVTMVIIMTVIAFRAIKKSETANNWVVHTQQVIGRTQNLLLELYGAENSQSQYLLTSNPQKLKDYHFATSTIKRDLRDLRNLVGDNPSQVAHVDSFIKYTNLKLGDMIKVVASQTSPSYEVGHYLFKDTEPIDNCKLTAEIIVSNERKLLTLRENISARKAENTVGLIILSGSIVVISLVLICTFIARTFYLKNKLKEMLQISESKFASAFNDSGIGMAIVSVEGAWVEVNPYLLNLLGYSMEELLAKTFQEITFPEDLNADLNLLHQLLKGQLNSYKLEKRYLHKDGYLVWALLTVSLVRNSDLSPRFFVSQIEDISDTIKLINELEVKNKALFLTSTDLKNRINQLEEFSGIVAHNLRGPAASIEMMLKMMAQEESEEEKADLLSMTTKSSSALNATLRDLMDILQVRLNQSIRYDSCDLIEIVEKTNNMLQGEILQSRAVINTKFEVGQIHFPKIYLESIFYNMISNSLKYKKPNIPVEILITSQRQDGKIKLVFEDNGLGIDLDKHGKDMFKLNKIFHQGFDSKGVGLFITKNQIETHGGTIKIESVPGSGSRFIIRL